MTHIDNALKHLKRGWTLTNKIASDKWDDTRLWATIHDLRAKGYQISDTWVTSKNGGRYKKYWMDRA